jgi:5-formyltetrahydrofolate cyclo-ligase
MIGMRAETDKKHLRRYLAQSRMTLDDTAWKTENDAIIRALIQTIDWKTIQRIHCYVPILERHEVDTWPLLRYIWRYWPGIETLSPGPLRDDRPVTLVIDRTTQWYDTAPPRPQSEKITVANPDIIIVPLLGFDDYGYRIGYGSGYYDRLLRDNPQAIAMGLALRSSHIPEGLPHEPHDIPLKYIFTTDKTLRF